MVERKYSFGIYFYIDKKDNSIVYIGKDSHIDINKRDKDHRSPSNYNVQAINQVIQNNPDRYKYEVYAIVKSIDDLNELEFNLINLYRPKFNFKHGGEGSIRFHEDFKYTVVKRGFKTNGKQNYCIYDRNQNSLISSFDKDFLESFIPLLNSNEAEGLKAIAETDRFKYTIVKSGFNVNGKQKYCICGRNNNQLINSIYKEFLDFIARLLNENESKYIIKGNNDFKLKNKDGLKNLYKNNLVDIK